MQHRTAAQISFLIALLAGTTTFLFSTQAVRAGHTYEGGDCWQAGTPYLCRANWPGPGILLYVRFIDQFSWARPEWLSPAQGAAYAWTSAQGPQVVSFSGEQNDTWVYLNYAESGTWDCYTFLGCAAVTVNCRAWDAWCTHQQVAMNIWWSDVYLIYNTMDGLSASQRQTVIAHETGHSLGLDHHGANPSVLMCRNCMPNPTGPTSTEVGPLPPCSGSSSKKGVRCIYNWPY